jgi:superfamily I DNA/RNA helicase
MHPPTEEQSAIIDFARTRTENLCVNALAGAAKTTTLEMICHAVDNIPILSLAFNKRIADELSKRLPAHVECRTFNSLGHRVWAQACGRRLTLEPNKMHSITKRLIEDLPRSRQSEAWEDFADTLRWLRYAKRDGYVPQDWEKLATMLIAEAGEDCWLDSYDDTPTKLQIVLIDSAMSESIRQGYEGNIDYDDQIYLPVIFGAPWTKYPLVLCDEVQDLSPINHVMLEKLVHKRVIIVGDPWQSIYGFRGAVANGMRQLVTKFNMHELPLSITFRVPKRGVERAHFRVPHMRAPEWQIDGRIDSLEHWGPECIPDGAAIICRNNAPLFKCGLKLLKAGRSIKLVGMEIGPGLIRIMRKLGPPTLSRTGIGTALDAWMKRELDKAKRAETVYDKYECLEVLCLRPDANNLGQAIAFAEDIFKRSGAIQLLSIHKAKGLEWETVFHLDSWRIPSKWAKPDTEEWEQEMNARYVCETRFKREMYLVNMEDFDG